MLVQCTECQREISDQAPTCPHCGKPSPVPLKAFAPDPPRPFPWALLAGLVMLIVASAGKPSDALHSAAIGGFLGLFGLIRGERGRWWGVVLMVWAISVAILASVFMTQQLGGGEAMKSDPLTGKADNVPRQELSAQHYVQIKSQRWVVDEEFAGRGVIKWYVEVENLSDRNIRNVEIEFTTYDAAGKLVATTSAYVSAIPGGESRAKDSYADLYRTEKTANFKVRRVRFE